MGMRFTEFTFRDKIQVGIPATLIITIIVFVLMDPGKVNWAVLVLGTGLVAVIADGLYRIQKRGP